MKILITGASGFIGRDLCSKLSHANNEVTGTFRNREIALDNRVSLVKTDITSRGNTDKLIQEHKPELIYHLAYDRNDLKNSIITGTENLLNSRKNFCPNSKFIFLSTDCVFSGNNPPYNEKSIPSPIDEYGKAKLEAEKLCKEHSAMIIRTALVYGIEKPDNNLNILIQGLETGVFDFPYFTDEIRTPVYLDDLTDSLIKAPDYYDQIKVLHISGFEDLSRYELAKLLADLFGYDPGKIPCSLQSEGGCKRPLNLTFRSIYNSF